MKCQVDLKTTTVLKKKKEPSHFCGCSLVLNSDHSFERGPPKLYLWKFHNNQKAFSPFGEKMWLQGNNKTPPRNSKHFKKGWGKFLIAFLQIVCECSQISSYWGRKEIDIYKVQGGRSWNGNLKLSIRSKLQDSKFSTHNSHKVVAFPHSSAIRCYSL